MDPSLRFLSSFNLLLFDWGFDFCLMFIFDFIGFSFSCFLFLFDARYLGTFGLSVGELSETPSAPPPRLPPPTASLQK